MAERTFTEDELMQAAWDMGMRLRNELQTWRDKPSYNNKSTLQTRALKILGAYDLLRFVGIAKGLEQYCRVIDLVQHLHQPGQDFDYRSTALELALLAFPFKEK